MPISVSNMQDEQQNKVKGNISSARFFKKLVALNKEIFLYQCFYVI